MTINSQERKSSAIDGPSAVLSPTLTTREPLTISSLPPETLCAIWTSAVREQGTAEGSVSITVSHVSRYWRGVALACPTLWNRIVIPCFKLPYIEELLHRSKQSPLIVSIRPGDGLASTDLCIQRVFSQMGRIRDLYIHCFREIDAEACMPFLLQPAPKLERFILTLEHLANTSMPLPTTLFEGEKSANLKDLILYRFSMPWDSPILRGLTRFVANLGDGPSITDIMLILISCPQLEELLIRSDSDSGASDENDDAPNDEPIQLPRLRQLDLTMDYHACTRLFDRIRVPESTVWSVGLRRYPFQLPGPVLRNPTPTRECHSIRCTTTYDYVSLEVRTPPTASNPSGTLWASIRADSRYHGRTIQVARELIQSTFHSRVADIALDVGWEGPDSQSSWHALAAALPNIHTMSLKPSADPSLNTVPNLMAALAAPEIQCPKLREIRFIEAPPWDTDEHTFAAMLSYLTYRNSNGRPLDKLVITNCPGFRIGHQEALQDLVVSIDVSPALLRGRTNWCVVPSPMIPTPDDHVRTALKERLVL